jgi:hypothetical protein
LAPIPQLQASRGHTVAGALVVLCAVADLVNPRKSVKNAADAGERVRRVSASRCGAARSQRRSTPGLLEAIAVGVGGAGAVEDLEQAAADAADVFAALGDEAQERLAARGGADEPIPTGKPKNFFEEECAKVRESGGIDDSPRTSNKGFSAKERPRGSEQRGAAPAVFLV